MEKKLKKWYIIIPAVVLVLAAAKLFCVPSIPYYNQRVLDNIESCDIAAGACLDFYEDSNNDGSQWCVSFDLENKKLYHHEWPEGCDEYDLTDEQVEAFENIYIEDVFYVDHTECNDIVMNEDFVAFTNDHGRASFIYSVSGRRPHFVNFPSSKKSSSVKCVKKINDHWYYVCKQI